MMNLVALCLVFTTLVTAGVWSPAPAPEKVKIKQDVIVKEGHRTVEIEYGENDGNTKVKISPQEGEAHADSSSLKGKVSEGVENVKEILEEVGHRASPRELVCDAYGKCKHKIASAVGKTKEVFTEKAHQVKDKVEEVGEEVKHTAGETVGKVKDTAGETGGKVKDAAGETAEKVKDAVSEKAQKVAEKVRDAKERLKKEAKDIGGTLKHDVKKNATEDLDLTKKKFGEAEEKLEQKQKGFKEILRSGSVFVNDVFGYIFSPEISSSGVGIIQLLAVSLAYGMGIWVTFLSSYIMSGALPRHQFAVVQSKIYPVYFKTMAFSVGMVLLAHCLSSKKGLHSGKTQTFQYLNLFA